MSIRHRGSWHPHKPSASSCFENATNSIQWLRKMIHLCLCIMVCPSAKRIVCVCMHRGIDHASHDEPNGGQPISMNWNQIRLFYTFVSSVLLSLKFFDEFISFGRIYVCLSMRDTIWSDRFEIIFVEILQHILSLSIVFCCVFFLQNCQMSPGLFTIELKCEIRFNNINSLEMSGKKIVRFDKL